MARKNVRCCKFLSQAWVESTSKLNTQTDAWNLKIACLQGCQFESQRFSQKATSTAVCGPALSEKRTGCQIWNKIGVSWVTDPAISFIKFLEAETHIKHGPRIKVPISAQNVWCSKIGHFTLERAVSMSSSIKDPGSELCNNNLSKARHATASGLFTGVAVKVFTLGTLYCGLCVL